MSEVERGERFKMGVSDVTLNIDEDLKKFLGPEIKALAVGFELCFDRIVGHIHTKVTDEVICCDFSQEDREDPEVVKTIRALHNDLAMKFKEYCKQEERK